MVSNVKNVDTQLLTKLFEYFHNLLLEGLAALGDFAESTTVVTRGYPAPALAAASSLTTTQQHHAPDPHSLALAAGPAQA